MATTPAISVLMSVYNGAAYLQAAVQSILDQEFADFEFLIVNDGSTDASGAILRRLAAGDVRIKLIERGNRGLVASLNELAAAASSPLLARMDCDDIAMPDRFSKQVVYLAAHPDIGILGSNTHDLDEAGRIVGTVENYPLTPHEAKAQLKDGPPLCHPSVMMRTDLVRQLGGYREAFRHAEDYDLWLRASRITAITNLRERLLLYRRSPSQISQKYPAQQSLAAIIAWFDHERCLGGKASLFDSLDTLPDFDQIDALFDHEGLAATARKMLVERMRYSPDMLKGSDFAVMMTQARSGGGFAGAGRTILRLGRMGKVSRAFLLAVAMSGALISSS